MNVIGIEERREAAKIIRAMGTESTCFASCSDRGAVEAMRVGGCSFKSAYLADLIDPTPWQNAVEDNHRLLDRCRELERENAALKNRIGGTDAHGLSLARPYLLRIARDLEREGLDGRAVTVDVGGYAERIREAVGSDAD